MITEEREKACRTVAAMKALPVGGMCPLPCPKHGIQSFIHKLPSFESAHFWFSSTQHTVGAS